MALLVQAAQPDLLACLSHVQGIVDRRQPIPILSHLLVHKAGQLVDLVASDLEIEVRVATRLGAGFNSVSTTIDARRLGEILKTMPGEDKVLLELQDDRVVLRTAESRFRLQSLAAADFPRVQRAADFDAGFEVTQGALKRLLAKVAFAMASQDVRYYLNGTQLQVDGRKLTAAATDSHRLAVATTDVDGQHERRDVILPRKAALELEKQLRQCDSPVRIQLAKSQARFEFGSVEFTTKLVEGRFPDWRRVLPPPQEHAVRAPRHRLLTALQRTAVVCDDAFKLVRIGISDGRMSLETTNGSNEEVRDQLHVEYCGDAVDAGFNVYYLIDALAEMGSDSVRIDFTPESSTALLTEPESDSLKCVVMPMRLSA